MSLKDDFNQDESKYVLIVEDDAGLQKLIIRLLSKHGYVAHGVDNGRDAVAFIIENPYYVMLLDHQLPDMTGMEVIGLLNEKAVKVPFVIMTGHGDERLAVELMKLGAADYLIKDIDFSTKLPSVFERLFKSVDTERRLKKAEESLRLSEIRFRNLVANVPGVIFQCEMDEFRTMNYISKGIESIIGIKPEQFVEEGEGFAQYIHPDDIKHVIGAIKVGVEKHKSYTITYRIIGKDSEVFWVQENGVGLYTPSGHFLYIDGVIVDITKIKKVEDALRNSEDELIKINQTKDKFFSIISHDLKGVFNVIIGLTDLLERKAKANNTENFEKISGAVNKTAQNAYSLLENLLNWAKIQTGKIVFNPELVSLESDIDGIVDMYSPVISEKQIDFKVNIQNDLLFVADSFMIQTVIRNLLTNAMKFTPIEGKISLEIKQIRDNVLFSVSDTGVGIDQDDISKLFRIDTAFSTPGTNKEPGSGLGLILCKEFVNMHNGRIWVESEPGKGSTFYFTIPVSV